MTSAQQKTLVHALQWYVDQGVEEALLDDPQDRTRLSAPIVAAVPSLVKEPERPVIPDAAPVAVIPKSELHEQAVKLAQGAQTLDQLREAIAGFEGIALKKTATNLVFSDGNPQAQIMLVGEAPGADEDRIGRPFVGVSGQLLDLILKSAGLERGQEDPSRSVYIANILNWRPPGNRAPAPGEVELSLPFIERHIQLVQPKILVLCGGVSAKALLGREDSISRLRKSWHAYEPCTPGLKETQAGAIPAIATYHPSYLLRTPSQKKAVWADMLTLNSKRTELELIGS